MYILLCICCYVYTVIMKYCYRYIYTVIESLFFYIFVVFVVVVLYTAACALLCSQIIIIITPSHFSIPNYRTRQSNIQPDHYKLKHLYNYNTKICINSICRSLVSIPRNFSGTIPDSQNSIGSATNRKVSHFQSFADATSSIWVQKLHSWLSKTTQICVWNEGIYWRCYKLKTFHFEVKFRSKEKVIDTKK